jgi:hypothetical protein
MHRILPIALVVLGLPMLAGADWTKAYFAATKPGTWAKHRLTTSVTKPSTTTYTRLPDENGQVVIDQLAEFSDDSSPTSTMRYHLAPGFNADRELIDFLTVIVAAASRIGAEGPFDPLPADTVSAIKAMPTYRATAAFKGTERIDGKSCDRYVYTRKHATQTETGELCLSPSIPFGLVKQKITNSDAAGKVENTAEVTLVDSGSSK